MQCTSYQPVCHTTKDLTVKDKDRTWLLDDNNTIWETDHGYNGLFPLSNINRCQGYEKEALRQIMLQHEATFKEQVSELHQLYNRQRQLMEEMKRRDLKQNPEAKTSQSNPSLCQRLSESARKTCHIPRLPLAKPTSLQPSALFTKEFQASSNFVAGKSEQTAPDMLINASTLKDLKLLPCNSKKPGKRTFDLELPANEYIDSEGGEKFEGREIFQISEAPEQPYKVISVYHQSDSKFSLCSSQLNSFQGGLFGGRVIIDKTNDLAGLNNTFQLEQAGTLSSSSHLDSGTCKIKNWSIPITGHSIPCFEKTVLSSKNSTSSVQNSGLYGNEIYLTRNLTCCPSSQGLSLQNSILPGFRSALFALGTCPTSSNLNPLKSTGISAKEVDPALMVSSGLPDLQISQEKESAVHGNKNYKDSVRGLHWLRDNQVHKGNSSKEKDSLTQVESDSVKACLMSSSDVELKSCGIGDSSNCEMVHERFANSIVTSNQFSAAVPKLDLNLSEDKVTDTIEKSRLVDCGLPSGFSLGKGKWSAEDHLEENGVDYKCQIDLNSSLNEDECGKVLMNITVDINLEPPVSPENKESSPPRGKSEEKQLATTVQLSEQEEGYQDKDEDIAMIAAEALVYISSAGLQLDPDNSTSKPSETSWTSLQWFAGIVSSMADVLENEIEIILSAADKNDNELLANSVNIFAAMTLELKEMKTKEYCCMSTSQKKRTRSTLLPTRPKRRRARRTKSQKDFQGESSLPIASLMRNEVIEDLPIIGRLGKAAGTPPKTGFERENARRNGRRRGKKCTSISSPIVVEQQAHDTNLGFLEDCMPSWGKKDRRQNGVTVPAHNPSLNHTKLMGKFMGGNSISFSR